LVVVVVVLTAVGRVEMVVDACSMTRIMCESCDSEF
jgi:hypothetical protein